MAELPFGYRDRVRNSNQQGAPREPLYSPFLRANRSRFNEPDVMADFDLDSVFELGNNALNNAQNPPQPPSQQPQAGAARMNANAAPWAAQAGGNPYVYPPPSNEQIPQYPFSDSVYGYMSRNPAPTMATATEMASRQRQAMLATAAAHAVEREAVYEQLREQQESPSKSSPPPSKPAVPAARKPVEGECPVCWDSFIDTQTILFCKTTCGHNFHKTCIVEWLTAPSNRQVLLKCPMCRGPWDDQELKELHQENGIALPRPNKRFRSDPGWAVRNQARDHFRRLHRQRVYERRNNADRSRASPVTYDSRPNFPGRPAADQQSPQMSPTTPTSPQNRPSPMMVNQMPTTPAFSPVQRPPQGMVQAMIPNSNLIQVPHVPRPAAFAVPQYMPNNVTNPNNGVQPGHMINYQFQPPLEVPASYRTQQGPAYPVYPAMTAQNYQPANTMQYFTPMSPNRPQNFPIAPMPFTASPLQQHPCPAMRQQAISTQQQVHPNNFMAQTSSPVSPASSWELRQFHYSQTYTVYMNH
jgi:hypothetical protein